VAVAAGLALALGLGALAAAAAGGYALDWWTSDGGGGASQGGGYALSGTLGQPDAGQAAGGGYTLGGGFWRGGAAAPSATRFWLPIIAAGGAPAPAPDLVAAIDLVPQQTTVAVGEPVEVRVTVTNQGAAPAGPFWVDLYINPSRPPDAAGQPWNKQCGMQPCFGMAWNVAEGLGPGQRVTLSSNQMPPGYSVWPGWFAAGASELYAYADGWNSGAGGAVAEHDETHNRAALAGLSVTGPNPQLAGLQSAADLPARPAP
jgi:hypothetical protein